MFENTKIYNQDIITKAEKKTFEKTDSFLLMKKVKWSLATMGELLIPMKVWIYL